MALEAPQPTPDFLSRIFLVHNLRVAKNITIQPGVKFALNLRQDSFEGFPVRAFVEIWPGDKSLFFQAPFPANKISPPVQVASEKMLQPDKNIHDALMQILVLNALSYAQFSIFSDGDEILFRLAYRGWQDFRNIPARELTDILTLHEPKE